MPPFSRTFPFSGSISVLTHARTRPCNWPLKQSDSSRLAVRAAGRKKSIFPSGYAGQECVGAQVGPEVKFFGFSFKKAKTEKKFNIAASAHAASNIHHRPFLFICSIEVDRLRLIDRGAITTCSNIVANHCLTL
jgi:hypothetical protein